MEKRVRIVEERRKRTTTRQQQKQREREHVCVCVPGRGRDDKAIQFTVTIVRQSGGGEERDESEARG